MTNPWEADHSGRIDTAVLDLLIEKYSAQMRISPEVVTASIGRDEIFGDVILRLVRKVATLPSKDELRVPRRWHDAFVEQYRHARGLRGYIAREIEKRHPVEFATYRASEVLPNFPVLDKYRQEIRIYNWQQTGGFGD